MGTCECSYFRGDYKRFLCVSRSCVHCLHLYLTDKFTERRCLSKHTRYNQRPHNTRIIKYLNLRDFITMFLKTFNCCSYPKIKRLLIRYFFDSFELRCMSSYITCPILFIKRIQVGLKIVVKIVYDLFSPNLTCLWFETINFLNTIYFILTRQSNTKKEYVN